MAAAGPIERRMTELAHAQGGSMRWEQLRDLGLTRGAIRARVARGSLIRSFPSVYTVTSPDLLSHGREAAALLSIGPEALLSHRTAAAIWQIAPADDSVIDITLPRRRVRPRPGVRIHSVSDLQPPDVRVHIGLPLTAPARTMIDFAAQATSSELESAFGEARARRLVNDAALTEALARVPDNHRGAAVIRRWMRDDPGSTHTRSWAERRIRGLMRAAELPQPLVNVRLCGHTADFLWADAKLVLEVDGYGTHGHRLAFENDRRRDQVHVAAGYTVIRVTWRQLQDEPLGVVARIAQALALRAA